MLAQKCIDDGISILNITTLSSLNFHCLQKFRVHRFSVVCSVHLCNRWLHISHIHGERFFLFAGPSPWNILPERQMQGSWKCKHFSSRQAFVRCRLPMFLVSLLPVTMLCSSILPVIGELQYRLPSVWGSKLAVYGYTVCTGCANKKYPPTISC